MADIVLRDRNGNQVEYPGVESIKLNTVGGDTKEFIDPDTVPQAVEKTIDPDFSTGDMEVIPEEGQVFSKVGISKPDNLIPGNIAEGVDIAGIVGTLASGGGGGLDDWNAVVKPWTAPEATSQATLHTIVTNQELKDKGIQIVSGESANVLKTLALLVRVSTSATTSDDAKRINIGCLCNWQLATHGTSNKLNRAFLYQASSTNASGYSVNYISSSTMWEIQGLFGYTIFSLGETRGLTTYYKTGDNFYPIGTYIAIVLQHKTKTVSEEL